MKAKMKGFSPVMKDGQHAGYSNSHGTYYNFTVEFEDGSKGQASSSKTEPSWKIGEEYEFEVVVNGNYTNIKKMKPVNGFGGGYKKPVLAMKEIKRMVKSNAVHCIAVVNNTYSQEIIKGNGLKVIETFTIGSLAGDIDKFSEEDSLLTSRLACINNAAIMAGYKSFETAEQVVQAAEGIYKYIKG